MLRLPPRRELWIRDAILIRILPLVALACVAVALGMGAAAASTRQPALLSATEHGDVTIAAVDGAVVEAPRLRLVPADAAAAGGNASSSSSQAAVVSFAAASAAYTVAIPNSAPLIINGVDVLAELDAIKALLD